MKTNNYNGLFVTDLDGTLLTDEKTISSNDLYTLAYLREQGIATAIATGRSDYSFFKLIESLGELGSTFLRSVDFSIFSTGAGILGGPDMDLLQNHSLAPHEVLNICAYLESMGIDYMIHRAIPETVYFSYRQITRKNSDFKKRIELYQDYGVPLGVEKDRVVWSGAATEILCIIPGDRGGGVAAEIAKKLKPFSVIRATSPLDHTSTWVEIFSPAVSKSSAIDCIAREIGVEQKHVCAVGNDYNDQDLLLWAGAGYLVENGPSSLKGTFTTVPSNNNSGVSAAARSWIEKHSKLGN